MTEIVETESGRISGLHGEGSIFKRDSVCGSADRRFAMAPDLSGRAVAGRPTRGRVRSRSDPTTVANESAAHSSDERRLSHAQHLDSSVT